MNPIRKKLLTMPYPELRALIALVVLGLGALFIVGLVILSSLPR